jgi:hypothetical protein
VGLNKPTLPIECQDDEGGYFGKKIPWPLWTRDIKNPYQQRMLRTLSLTGNVSMAAQAAGIVKQTHYNWIMRDPEYAKQVEMAKEYAADIMEAEAWRRAIAGVTKPIMRGDKVVGEDRVFSDQLLMFLLKGARPEKYRESHKVEHSGIPNQAPVTNNNVLMNFDLRKLSDAELQHYERLLTRIVETSDGTAETGGGDTVREVLSEIRRERVATHRAGDGVPEELARGGDLPASSGGERGPDPEAAD